MSKHIIITAPSPLHDSKGGIARQMRYVMDESTQYDDGITFHWLATHNNTPFWPLYFCASICRLFWLIIHYRPESIILNIASRGSFFRKYVIYRIARFAGLHIIAYLHGGGFKDFHDNAHPTVQYCIKDTFCNAHHVITLGQSWKRFVESLGCLPERVHIMRNAVPAAHPKPTTNPEPHIIFAGHLLERKGIGELIKALATTQHLPWHATLAGSGDDSTFHQLAEDCGLSERITFTGWLDEDGMTALYQTADIMVLPSHIENQPLCLLEALAYGLGIISTNVGTIPEILTDRHDALLITSKDVDALSNALTNILESTDLLETLQRNALQTYQKNYQLGVYYQQLVALIAPKT